MSGSAPRANMPSLVTRSASRVAALPYCARMQTQTPWSFLFAHAVWKAARSIECSRVLIPTALKLLATDSPIEKYGGEGEEGSPAAAVGEAGPATGRPGLAGAAG